MYYIILSNVQHFINENTDFLERVTMKIGFIGAGHSVKLMNNFLGQLNGSAIAEMLLFGHKYGVDLKAFYDVVSVSGGNSTMFQGMVPKVFERDFTVNFMLKLVQRRIHQVHQRIQRL
jgi:3-hydroxyisobutyrate dehydrogenase-like beta-hydroxyacid dehydrogenase